MLPLIGFRTQEHTNKLLMRAVHFHWWHNVVVFVDVMSRLTSLSQTDAPESSDASLDLLAKDQIPKLQLCFSAPILHISSSSVKSLDNVVYVGGLQSSDGYCHADRCISFASSTMNQGASHCPLKSVCAIPWLYRCCYMLAVAADLWHAANKHWHEVTLPCRLFDNSTQLECCLMLI